MKVVQFTLPVSKEESVIVQEDVKPHFYPHLHRHSDVQITWVIEGAGTLIAGDYMEDFGAGDIYIFGANLPHLFKSELSYFEKDSGKTVRSISIFFNPDDLLKPLFSLPEMRMARQFIEAISGGGQVRREHQERIGQLIQTVLHSAGVQRIGSFVSLIEAFCQADMWLPLSSIRYADTLSEKEGLRINEVYQYTLLHFKEDISLQTVADIAHLTPQAFCRYFKKRTGKTYVYFLNEIRINEACKKLADNQFDQIAGIAYACGFNNVTSFNRVFKQIKGMPPNQYMKKFFINTYMHPIDAP